MSEASGSGGAHISGSKHSAPKPRANIRNRTTTQPDTAERYNQLQRKVVDLERLHNDGKKTHQSEIERLKHDLAHVQKLNAELTDQTDKQKKQNETLELRVDELKKASNSDRAEIKDLGVKLRLSEHMRTQMSAKHGESGEWKKAVQAAEMRRREEGKEKDRAIADLGKTLSAEKKKREMMERQSKEAKAKHELEIDKLKAGMEKLKSEFATANDAKRQLELSLDGAISEANETEEALLARLGDHRVLLARLAEQYGLLASNTVSKTAFEQLKLENCALRIQAARSSRKLGNTEAQVSELTHLIRQSMEEKQLLQSNIDDLMQELVLYTDHANLKPPSPPSYAELDRIIATMDQEFRQSQEGETQAESENLQLLTQLYHLEHEGLLSAYAEAQTELLEMGVVAAKLPEVERERDTAQELLQATTVTAESLKVSSERFKRRAEELERRLKVEGDRAAEVLRKEKDAVHRLTGVVQKMRMAEDGLRAENEQLTLELTEAERFQEAYYSLAEQLEGLLARNALAEDEAQRLSQFNAEIIGHHNPLQRIMYVERIRNELADTKLKLLASTRENEAITNYNQNLHKELEMYKSVAVPYELKPGTKFTRMTRPPLVNLNRDAVGINIELTDNGDMTLDELS
ncbi:hypothetical protein F5878DRAFT_653202 [Lentinula raphanica]|uniref:Hyaluronan-mediated motility receptor C-terminal domain-containing protein n=1 Tax=Lentinula raphanica TaxID=153919 RepID=A0AA38UFI3_9AGAR|nr:hypothetical protein F5878DRAFT_653202 [Lentinula raphanica]